MEINERLDQTLERMRESSQASAILESAKLRYRPADLHRLIREGLESDCFDDETLAQVREYASERSAHTVEAYGSAENCQGHEYLRALDAVRELRTRRAEFEREHPLIVKLCTLLRS